MLRAAAIALLLVAVFIGQAAAVSLSEAAGRYLLSGADSSLAFTVPALSGPGIHGRFTQFSGIIDIAPDDIGRSQVVISIDPASVVAGERRIDAFLKSDAVFDVANENEIVFRSTSVRRTGDDTATIEGTLTARGRTFRETFTVTLAAFTATAIRFHVTGKLLRSRYGMDVGTPIYSNVVDFDMDLTARRR